MDKTEIRWIRKGNMLIKSPHFGKSRKIRGKIKILNVLHVKKPQWIFLGSLLNRFESPITTVHVREKIHNVRIMYIFMYTYVY